VFGNYIYLCQPFYYAIHFTVCGPFFCGSYFMLSQSFTCVSHFMLSQSFPSVCSHFVVCKPFYNVSAIFVFLQPFYAISVISKLFASHFMSWQPFYSISAFPCCVSVILFLCQLFHVVLVILFLQSFYLFCLRHFICACHFWLLQPFNKSLFIK
jgi:hypothetical protein